MSNIVKFEIGRTPLSVAGNRKVVSLASLIPDDPEGSDARTINPGDVFEGDPVIGQDQVDAMSASIPVRVRQIAIGLERGIVRKLLKKLDGK